MNTKQETNEPTIESPFNLLHGPIPDHFLYAEDFEKWIKDNPPQPISEERLALDKRRREAIARMSEKAKNA